MSPPLGYSHFSPGPARAAAVGVLLFAGLAAGMNAQTTVFSTNFDGGSIPAEISPGTATLTGVQGYAGLGPPGNQFGGSFLRSATANTVTLQLNGLPAHTSMNVHFLFAENWGQSCIPVFHADSASTTEYSASRSGDDEKRRGGSRPTDEA